MKRVLVVDYDPQWPQTFALLSARIRPAVADVALTIEHVGSTAVPGLAAKPVVDMSIVVASSADVAPAIARLATVGYGHRGDLGVEGREAFTRPPELPAHHLYLCARDSLALRNHLAVRDYLRTHADAAREYGALKHRLAAQHEYDIDAYGEGKTALLLELLRRSGMEAADLSRIELANRRAP